jgi:uncharacterized protein (TIGR00255 family)
MIKSMTGFAATAKAAGAHTVSVEIRSYNSRHLDLALRAGQGCANLEERIRAMIAQHLVRGRIEVKIQVEDNSADGSAGVEVDLQRARSVLEALNRLKTELGLENAPSLELLVSAGGILKTVQAEADAEDFWPAVETGLGQALKDLDAMRIAEGRNLATDLDLRLGAIAGSLADIAKTAQGALSHYQERLKERVAALTQGVVEIDPTRLAQEAAFLADRADISEEIVRAESHIREFRAIMAAEEAGGRKLNFLLQELNREFNTMGSKIGHADAAHVIVAVKSELEKIREQVQNIE